MKAYTDLEQSKKLQEILPLESADMYYQYILPKSNKIEHTPKHGNPAEALEWYNKGYTKFGKEPLSLKEYCIPCWSLAALLDILPHEIKIWDITYNIKIYPNNNNWFISYKNNNEEFIGTYSTFLIDACIEMIIKLKKKGLI